MQFFFLFVFISIVHLSHGMDTTSQAPSTEELMQALPQATTHFIFKKQIEQAVKVCQPTIYNEQKDLIRYIITISRVTHGYYDYINSLEYIKTLFNSLPIEIHFPLMRRLLKKSFTLESYHCLVHIWVKLYCWNHSIALQKYCFYTVDLCNDITSLSEKQLLRYLKEGANPNFYINLNNKNENVPPVLIKLIHSPSHENTQKVALILSHGADVNIEPTIAFNRYSNSCIVMPWPKKITPLAVAIAKDNEAAIKIVLDYKPADLCFDELFLSTNNAIKKTMLTYPDIQQDDLDKGLTTALKTHNGTDIVTLLKMGAHHDPQELNKSKPNLELTEFLLTHGAYDSENIKNLKRLRDAADNAIKRHEKNALNRAIN